MPAAAPGAHAVLARAGLRATPPRLAVWKVLREANDEPGAVDVLRRVRSMEPRTCLGTVDRFLREPEWHGLACSRAVLRERSRWRLGHGPAADGMAPPDSVALAAAFGYQLVPAGTRSPAR